MVRGRRGGDHADMQTRNDSPTTTEKTTPRLITRSRDDRMLGGVCGGIARHLDVDPVIVRIATVALVCAVGAGLVAYLAAWILMPLDDESGATMPSAPRPAPARPPRGPPLPGRASARQAGLAQQPLDRRVVRRRRAQRPDEVGRRV